MDIELKTKWIEALRSGEFKQGPGYLNREGAFCCLGVLCDISGEGFWEPEPASPSTLRYVIGREWNRACLPIPISEKYDVREIGALIGMNDDGKPFSEIADYIEKNL